MVFQAEKEEEEAQRDNEEQNNRTSTDNDWHFPCKSRIIAILLTEMGGNSIMAGSVAERKES